MEYRLQFRPLSACYRCLRPHMVLDVF